MARGDRARLGPVAEALLGEWRDLSERFAPSNFLRLTCFAAETGTELLNCAQWTSDEEHRTFAGTHRSGLVARIDREMPGIVRPGLVRYCSYRAVRPACALTAADRVLLVEADSKGMAEARAWAAATAEELQANPWPELVSAHLLISVDGSRALLYATCAGAAAPVRVADVPGVRSHASRVYFSLGFVLGPQG